MNESNGGVDIIVSLFVQEGNKPGQPIASYRPSRRESHLVFMPVEAPVGDEVRVRLIETGRTDKRGAMMYRAEPAHEISSEIWRDNGDKTASRMQIETDWLGNTRESIIETRALKVVEFPLEAREKKEYDLVLGENLDDALVVERTVCEIPRRSEVVLAGSLTQQIAGSIAKCIGEEIIEPVHFATTIQSSTDIDWKEKKCSFEVILNDGRKMNITKNWEEIPFATQIEMQKHFPICACGRNRIEISKAGGYGKCHECRQQEACSRCGAKPGQNMMVLAGKIVCSPCEVYEMCEQEIKTLAPQFLRSIAKEAKLLLEGTILPRETGLAILNAGLDHVEDAYTRQCIRNNWENITYTYFVFLPNGVWATVFSPVALQILSCLDSATGNQLVELVSWFAHPGYGSEFFSRTQKGENITVKKINATQIKKHLDAKSTFLCYKIRGGEGERILALQKYKEFIAMYGETQYYEVQKIKNILDGRDQDYQSAITAIEIAVKQIEKNKKNRAKNFSDIEDVETYQDSEEFNSMADALMRAMQK